MVLSLKRKTGLIFAPSKGGIIIKEKKGGAVIYSRRPTLRTVIFNLPKGEFEIVEGDFFNKTKPLKYPLQKLPKKHLNGKPPKRFKETFGENPNKCTMNRADNTIFWDKQFHDSLSQLHKDFIIAHEKGHYYYLGMNSAPNEKIGREGEKACDLYALNTLLIQGYNAGQIAYAMNSTGINDLERNKTHIENAKKSDNIRD